MTHNEIRRRSYIERRSPAEKAIMDAMAAVEKAGADVRLTEAVMLLDQAFNKVADFVDETPPCAGVGQHPDRGPNSDGSRVWARCPVCHVRLRGNISYPVAYHLPLSEAEEILSPGRVTKD